MDPTTAASELKVAAALSRAQEKFDPILKDTNNPFYKSKYATLDQVMAATQPHLRSEGLIILQENVQDGDRYGIATRLLHLESGEELHSRLLAKPKEDTIQQITGILTYCRRYEYHTITGTASEDDDGALASGTAGAPEPRRPQSIHTKPMPPLPNAFPRTASNTTTTAIGSPLVHDNASPVPQVPMPVPQMAVTPAVSEASADPNAIPDSRDYQVYATQAMAILETLEKNGLTAGRGVTNAKNKFKKYLCTVGGVKDTKELTHGRWDVIFTEFAKLLATPEGTKLAVSNVEAASAKESK